MRRSLIALAVVCLTAGSALAQAGSWQGANVARLPAGVDVDFALSELCFPFLLNDAPIAEVVDRPGVRPAPGAPPDQRDRAFQIAEAPLVVVFEEREAGRDCTLFTEGGVDDSRAAFDARMGQWPQALTLAPYQFPPNDYDTREFFCSPPDGPQARVLISTDTGPPGAIMATISRDAARNNRCDGVAPSDARDPDPPAAATDPASPELRAWSAVSICRTALLEPARADELIAQMSAAPMSAPYGQTAWSVPGPGDIVLIGLGGEDECQIVVQDADPALLRQTVTVNIEGAPGISRGVAGDLPLQGGARTLDLWCMRDGRDLFGVLLYTGGDVPAFMLLGRQPADSPRCPPAPD